MPGSEDPYHFEIVINPYSDEKNAFVRVMYRRDFNPAELDPPPSVSGTRVGDDIVSTIGSMADMVGFAVPHMVNILFGQVGEEVSGYTQTHRHVFGDSTIFKPNDGTASTELGVSVANAKQATDIIMGLAKEHNFPGVIALRFVRPTVATLGFTKFSPLTCTIELPGLNSENTSKFFAAVFSSMDAAHIPFTLHWGQQGDYSAIRLNQMYGDAVDEWMNAREHLLPDPWQRYTFTNDFMNRCGLSEPIPLVGGSPIV